MQNSKIQWTDNTFNPWIGCAKVSPACLHCYADTMNNFRSWNAVWGKDKARHRTSESTWRNPILWNQQAMEERTVRSVFCASLADVFEENAHAPLDEWREELHDRLILRTPSLNWQLLTKRPENIAKFYRDREIPFNVWLGTSVENQEWAEKRIPALMENDSPVSFLSCEPLLGPLDLRPWLSGIQWVIVGGESGGSWREMNPDWARSIRDQCQEFGVPFFFKQWSGFQPKKLGRELDGREWNELPA